MVYTPVVRDTVDKDTNEDKEIQIRTMAGWAIICQAGFRCFRLNSHPEHNLWRVSSDKWHIMSGTHVNISTELSSSEGGYICSPLGRIDRQSGKNEQWEDIKTAHSIL